MTGFEPQTSSIGSDGSTNWAEPQLPPIICLSLQLQTYISFLWCREQFLQKASLAPLEHIFVPLDREPSP